MRTQNSCSKSFGISPGTLCKRCLRVAQSAPKLKLIPIIGFGLPFQTRAGEWRPSRLSAFLSRFRQPREAPVSVFQLCIKSLEIMVVQSMFAVVRDEVQRLQ